MSSLEPLTNLPTIEDPGVTRLVIREAEPRRFGHLVRTARTSCSIIVVDGDGDLTNNLRVMASWNPSGIRTEVVVCTPPASVAKASLRKDLVGSGVYLRFVDQPLGGRACVLAEAIEQAMNEFIIVTTSPQCALDRAPALLSRMWTEGSDVGMVSVDNRDLCVPSAESKLDAASQLTEWLGLSGTNVPGRMVMMRRWVARWLFNEISRSLEPAEELADRARLLGLTIIQLR